MTLFQSIQLNINNPHFLIMQGRITKVLHMKPEEILAMIEEAAGTRMFEEKKAKALKTIDKKDQKLAEIRMLMENDIAPKLDKLRDEKTQFLNFQKIEGEIERLGRFVIAYDFKKCYDKLLGSEDDISRKSGKISDLEVSVEQIEQEIRDISESIESVLLMKEKELKKSGRYQELQAETSEMENELTRAKAQEELKSTAIKDEKSNLKSLREAKSKSEKSLEEITQKLVAESEKYEQEKNAVQEEKEQVKRQEGFLQTLTTGIADSEGQENGFSEQIEAAKAEKMQAGTEIERIKQRTAFVKDQLKAKQPKAKVAEKDNQSNLKKFKKLQNEVDELKDKLDQSAGFDADEEASLRRQASEKSKQAKHLQEKLDAMKGQLSSLDFKYTDPYKGFDNAKVKGMVARLIKIDPENIDYTTALQVCAEGRLFFVVVDDNKVASDLLQKGKLKRKYTIIPLQQIAYPNIAPERINQAKSVAPGKVESALELIGYNDEVESAMKFVFSGTLICKDAASAKKVAYDDKVKMRSITIDGDVYEPGATITGGSAPSNVDILGRLHKLSMVENQYSAIEAELQEITRKLAQMEEIANNKMGDSKALRKKEYELQTLEKVMKLSPAGQLLAEVEGYRKEIDEADNKLSDLKKKQKECDSKIKRLQAEMKDFEKNKDGKLKKIEKELKEAKASLDKRNKALKKSESEYKSLEQDKKEIESEIRDLDAQIEAAIKNLSSLEEEAAEMSSQLYQLKEKYEELSSELHKHAKTFARFDKDLKGYEQAKKQKMDKLNETQLELTKLNYEIDSQKKENLDSSSLVDAMLEQNPWIRDQKANFGRPNTAFDFDSQNPKEAKNRLAQLEQEHETLRKKINVKVMNMIDRVVTKERSLKQMLDTVQKDKSKIEETIVQLDEYKRDALNRTWTTVNKEFGEIFNELLPGNTAKLQPPPGEDVSKGLEVKVCLGDVWKNNLEELSGGQRSLVALSLILSLLRFKPAPMYILDEIDSALDLSHTQNIGHLFKTRFKGSQFIVVSLKEGMFNNAQVLFRAKFRDGTSMVERYTQGNIPDASEGDNSSKKKRKGKENKLSANPSTAVDPDSAVVASKKTRRGAKVLTEAEPNQIT